KGPRARLSDRMRQRAARGGAALLADPRGIWRGGPAAYRRLGNTRGNSRERLQRRRLPRADVYDGHAAAPRLGGAAAEVSAGNRKRGAAPAGLRCDRTDRKS